MNMRLLWLVSTLAVIVSLGSLGVAAPVHGHDRGRGHGAELRLETALVGSPASPEANGRVRFEEKNGDRRFELRVENAEEFAGEKVQVFVDGKKAGSIMLDEDGRGRLRVRTDKGNNVPKVRTGSLIEVKSGDTLVASATFVRVTLNAQLNAVAAFPGAEGTARFRQNAAQRKLDVKVANLKALAGASLDVFVDGMKVGALAVDAEGLGRLRLRTIEGHVVPAVNPGSIAEVKSGGTLVVSGAFQ